MEKVVIVGRDAPLWLSALALYRALTPAGVKVEVVALPDRMQAADIYATLPPLEHEPARVLSGGQRKLLELARILMADPQAILLDEPAAGVNPALLEILSAFVLKMYRERPSVFLVIEHNMEFIMGLAREIIVMHQGTVLERGDPPAIQASPRVIEAYLG